MQTVKLLNGVLMPQIGMGTWQINDREVLASIIERGYDMGYRLIDTAAAYGNEIGIGKALEKLSVPRGEMFLSDKVWNSCRGYEKVREACKRSMKKLKTDYLDLYLVHWPASPKLYSDWEAQNASTWRGMESLYRDGYVRAIGVCNFKPHHIEALGNTAEIQPMVNQIEVHPGMMQSDTTTFCAEKNICIEASSPLGNGQILSQELISTIAKSHDKTPAQICLRYVVEQGFVVIPKTSSSVRLAENMDIFDFSLTPDEKASLSKMPYCGGVGIDPDEVTEFG